MLKKSASVVLTSLRGSTYGGECDSPLYSLRPCRTAFLSILCTFLNQAIVVHSCVCGPYPNSFSRSLLNSDSNRRIKIITVFVSAGGHLGEDGRTIEVRALKPMDVADIKIQVGGDRPLRLQLDIMP